jgi:hypothetical protein
MRVVWKSGFGPCQHSSDRPKTGSADEHQGTRLEPKVVLLSQSTMCPFTQVSARTVEGAVRRGSTHMEDERCFDRRASGPGLLKHNDRIVTRRYVGHAEVNRKRARSGASFTQANYWARPSG